MPLPLDEQEFLSRVKPPPHAECVRLANEFLGRTGLSSTDFADLLRRDYGRVGRSTILIYLRGDYESHPTIVSTRWMDARFYDFLQRHRPAEPQATAYGEMLETRGYRIIRERLEEAIHEGVNALIYGPPSSEKSFVLENLCAARAAAGHRDAVYVYCEADMSPMNLLRRLAQEAQVWIARAYLREQYTDQLRRAFAARPYPPALVFDEAQHLPLVTLEVIRGLHDRTRRANRPGCGIILTGSHDLYRKFHHPAWKSRLVQWEQRLPHRVQLEAMTREEVLKIAAKALGNGKHAKLTERHQELLLARCTEEDVYATDANGEPLRDAKGQVVVRTYYASRKLLEYIRQQKKKKNLKAVLVGEVA